MEASTEDSIKYIVICGTIPVGIISISEKNKRILSSWLSVCYP